MGSGRSKLIRAPGRGAPKGKPAPLLPPDPTRVAVIAALPAFRAARFVITPTMPVDLLTTVHEARKAGPSIDALERAIVTYYDSHPELLDALVGRLCTAPTMVGRKEVLQQTLKAHRDRYDAMTVYALLPIIEGITIRATSTAFASVTPFKMAQKLRDDSLKRWPIGTRIDTALRTLIVFAESHLYKSFNWDNEDERRESMATLNRHTYLHGVTRHGSRADTLRCFLILDLIVAVMRDIAGGAP